jgi:hypothetical protein
MRSKICPCGLGEAWIAHLVPFHRSARLAFANEPPTAVQADGEVQATPSRRGPWTPAGLGVVWMLHLLPFQRSASVAEGLPLLSTAAPTAVQTNAEGHASQFRMPPPGEEGFGVGWMLHLVPFHRSASVGPTGSPFLSTAAPTAVQADDPLQSTPDSSAPRVPAGFGVAWMRHLVPFHRSAMVTQVPEAFTTPATAVQAEAEVHATEFKNVPCAPRRCGIGTTLHLVPVHRSESGCSWPELFE